jgi:translation elongation factor EF-Ts
MATYKDSQKQEKALARKLGGSVNAGSGNQWIRKSDVRTEDVLVEAKITSAKSFSLKDDELIKNRNYAIVDGRMPIFLVEFKTTGNSYVILTEDDFLDLRERANSGHEVTNGFTAMV